ncbi:MAG: hypothetical protein GY820_38620 [Gammaproteobacteria bacterium]|nr:hypothetical protein [Gammaproteobacteria bacterium]
MKNQRLNIVRNLARRIRLSKVPTIDRVTIDMHKGIGTTSDLIIKHGWEPSHVTFYASRLRQELIW